MKVLLVDDHPLFREGVANLFTAHGITIAGVASDGLEALEKARRLQPDVILMDVYMSGCDGLTATRLIKAELPQIKIVMMTASEEDDNLLEAIKSGASGYLLKKLDVQEILALFAELARGEPPLAPGLAMKVLQTFTSRQEDESQAAASTKDRAQLTPRQTAVLSLVAAGKTYPQVAEALCFSERTIKYELKQILGKLKLKNRTEAIVYAASIGLTGRKPE